MRLASPRLVLVASLAALAAFAAVPAAARADDGDPPAGKEGEPGADGEDGGEDAPRFDPPTMDGAVELSDGRRTLAMKFPKAWKPLDAFEPKGTHVGRIAGPLTTKMIGLADFHVLRAWSRGASALASLGDGDDLSPDDARSGPGWLEHGGRTSFHGQPAHVWRRVVEKDGVCYLFSVLSDEPIAAEVRPLVRQMLDTARVATPAPKAVPGSGVTVKKAGDFDVWTDADDAGKAVKLAELASEGRDAVVKALKGKPVDESRPVVRVWQAGDRYVEESAPVGTPDFAAYEPESRALLVQMFRSGDDDAPSRIRERAASQYLHQYFGGPPPAWVESGLRWYASAVAESGKADKPASHRVEGVRKAAAARKTRFDEWMDGKAQGTQDADAGYELYGWHVFFRHGPGKKYAKQYQGALDALRATGDPAQARKAWEGTDFAKMDEEFRAWATKWK